MGDTMGMAIIFIREFDLPYGDLDSKSVKFELDGDQPNEGHMCGTGTFDLIQCPKGLVRLSIHCHPRPGELVRIPMRPAFLSHLKRNPAGSDTEFSLSFRRLSNPQEN